MKEASESVSKGGEWVKVKIGLRKKKEQREEKK